MLDVRIIPRAQAPKAVHIAAARRRAYHTLYVRRNMLEAWSGLVSDLIKHPETEQHPVIWEGTKQITDGKIFTVDGLWALIERTVKAEEE